MKSHAVTTPLVTFVTSKKIVMAEGQRSNDVWDLAREQDLIDSVLNGYVIPEIFVAENSENNTIEVLDGQQRYNTLKRFRNNEFPIHMGDTKAGRSVYFNGLSDTEKETYDTCNLLTRVVSGTKFELKNYLKSSIVD